MTCEPKIAVVTGATRGCGRGIAVELGAIGMTVYVTGRTTRTTTSPMNRPETIEETAELVTAAGGRGIAVRCDFASIADVDALAARIAGDSGRLDLLVDDVWGGDPFVQGGPYWKSDLEQALQVVRGGIETHLIALHRLLPLLLERPGGLVVEVTDGDTEAYPGVGIPYYLVKSGVRALGRALGPILREHEATGLAITPGFLRSEMMLEHFGVREDNWRDGVAKDPHYAMSETPRYLGRAVAALAGDPQVSRFAGRTLTSWRLMHEYGFTDVDGSQPDWGRWFAEVVEPGADPGTVDAAAYR